MLCSFFAPTAIEAVAWIMAGGFFGAGLGYLAAIIAAFTGSQRPDPLDWAQHVGIWAGFLGSLFYLVIWVK